MFYGAGRHTLTRNDIGTRYVLVGVRILVNPSDPADLNGVHGVQHAIRVEQPDTGRFEIPDWDAVTQKTVRDALLQLATTLPDTKGMFGTKETTDPARRLIGSASAWGGNPEKDALYLNVVPPLNDGATAYRLTVGDVPEVMYPSTAFGRSLSTTARATSSRTHETRTPSTTSPPPDHPTGPSLSSSADVMTGPQTTCPPHRDGTTWSGSTDRNRPSSTVNGPSRKAKLLN